MEQPYAFKTTADIETKVQESGAAHQQIQTILNDVKKIEKHTGTEVQEIKAGKLQISKNELSSKEAILKGNEHYYKNEFEQAVNYYDKALGIDPNYADTWYNKGLALGNLGKYKEAIKCYDKALGIDPNDAYALNNRVLALNRLKDESEQRK